MGVLWGRDLCLFYNDGGLFSADEPKPTELRTTVNKY